MPAPSKRIFLKIPLPAASSRSPRPCSPSIPKGSRCQSVPLTSAPLPGRLGAVAGRWHLAGCSPFHLLQLRLNIALAAPPAALPAGWAQGTCLAARPGWLWGTRQRGEHRALGCGVMVPLGSCCPGCGSRCPWDHGMMGAWGVGSWCPWDHDAPGMMSAWAWDQGALGITGAWPWAHSPAGVTEPRAWDYSDPGVEVSMGRRCPGHAITVADTMAPSPQYPPALPAFRNRCPPCLPAQGPGGAHWTGLGAAAW